MYLREAEYYEFLRKIEFNPASYKEIANSLTLSPTAYQILWVPRGGAIVAPPLKVIEGAIFERGHGNRK